MRDVVLFIAMSLDGYIADKHGGVEWLCGEQPDADMPDTYGSFVRDVDTVIMGWNTYNQIVTELSPHEWAYKGLKSYVLTHRKMSQSQDICFTDESPDDLIKRLKRTPGRGIWICGGACVIRQLLDAGEIDTFHISIIPVLLGSGIRLFDMSAMSVNLRLVRAKHYNGIIEAVYKRR